MSFTNDYLDVAGTKPLNDDIRVGQIVTNLADGTLWTKNTSGIIIQLAESIGGSGCNGLEYSISPVMIPNVISNMPMGKILSYTITNYNAELTYRFVPNILCIITHIEGENKFTVQSLVDISALPTYTITIEVSAKDSVLPTAYSAPGIVTLEVVTTQVVGDSFMNNDFALNARYNTFSNLITFENEDFDLNARYSNGFSYELTYSNVDFNLNERYSRNFTDIKNEATYSNVDFSLNEYYQNGMTY